MKKEIKLTPRQWHLYLLIKERSEAGKRTDYEDLSQNLVINTDYSTMLMHGDFNRTIRKDVELINRANTIIQKPIINEGNGYFIPNSESQYKKWSKRTWTKIKKMIVELAEKDRKMELNNQYRITFEENGYVRDVIESVVKEVV